MFEGIKFHLYILIGKLRFSVPKPTLIYLILLCLFHLFGNIYWLSLNKTSFAWDQAGHTIIAFKFTDFLNGINANQDFLSISDYYPPFVHLLAALLMLIFGKHILIGPLLITAFFLLAIIFLYLYTFQLFKDKLVAIFAAALFSFLPNIYALSREFLLEIPLVAMTLGSLYFLEKGENFRDRKFSIIFFIFMALALSIKWTAAIFLFIPLIFKLKKMLPKIEWLNLSIGAVIVLLINLPWYLHNLPIILYASKITATPEISDPQNIFSYESLKYYLFMMTNFQLTWLGMIFFLISLPYFIFKRNGWGYFLLVTFLFVYLIFTLIGNKDLRYILFLAPIAVMIISFFLAKYRKSLSYLTPQYNIKRELITVLTWIIFSYYIFYYFSLSFANPVDAYQINYRRSINIPFFGWIDTINLGRDSSYYLAPTFDPTIWPNQTIAEELGRHNPQKSIRILIISEKPHLNQVNMELARRILNIDKIQFIAPYDIPVFSSDEILEKYLLGFNVILIADNNLGFEGGVRSFAARKQIFDFLKEDKSEKFTQINSYPLPDGDKLDVYIPKENS